MRRVVMLCAELSSGDGAAIPPCATHGSAPRNIEGIWLAARRGPPPDG